MIFSCASDGFKYDVYKAYLKYAVYSNTYNIGVKYVVSVYLYGVIAVDKKNSIFYYFVRSGLMCFTFFERQRYT